MTSELEPLVLDLVEWIAREPREYADVMDAWRTSCPRLTVWEETVERGLVTRDWTGSPRGTVVATPAGLSLLRARGLMRGEAPVLRH